MTIATVDFSYREQPDREPEARQVMVAGFNAIHEIDESDALYNEALVSAFLSAAWPSLRAQNQ
jgi:hypothetical protein